MINIERLIFDSHAHYDADAFADDRHELLTALPTKGVDKIMTVGADKTSSEAAVELSHKYDYIYAAVGYHPEAADEYGVESYNFLKSLAKTSPKIKAIGEIGLDYYWRQDNKQKQIEVFEEQLALATELDLPVIIHNREATKPTMEILQKYKPKGVMHCFGGSAETAKEVLKLELYIGFTGVITFKNARKSLEAIEVIPTDKLLIETDCPYMAPVPYRGKRSDSSMLWQTAEKMAEVKGISTTEMLNITRQNAENLFNII